MSRKDCESGPRPCPFVSCKYNLFLDVRRKGGILFNFGEDVDKLDHMTETCALDVAARDGVTLGEVGKYVNLDRERVRQVEEEALPKLKEVCEPAVEPALKGAPRSRHRTARDPQVVQAKRDYAVERLRAGDGHAATLRAVREKFGSGMANETLVDLNRMVRQEQGLRPKAPRESSELKPVPRQLSPHDTIGYLCRDLQALMRQVDIETLQVNVDGQVTVTEKRTREFSL